MISCPWPGNLRYAMQVLNALNVNLELLRPECDGPTTPYDKMVITLATPFAFIAVIVVYAAIRTAINAHVARLAHPPDSEESWLEGFKARNQQWPAPRLLGRQAAGRARPRAAP